MKKMMSLFLLMSLFAMQITFSQAVIDTVQKKTVSELRKIYWSLDKGNSAGIDSIFIRKYRNAHFSYRNFYKNIPENPEFIKNKSLEIWFKSRDNWKKFVDTIAIRMFIYSYCDWKLKYSEIWDKGYNTTPDSPYHHYLYTADRYIFYYPHIFNLDENLYVLSHEMVKKNEKEYIYNLYVVDFFSGKKLMSQPIEIDTLLYETNKFEIYKYHENGFGCTDKNSLGRLVREYDNNIILFSWIKRIIITKDNNGRAQNIIVDKHSILNIINKNTLSLKRYEVYFLTDDDDEWDGYALAEFLLDSLKNIDFNANQIYLKLANPHNPNKYLEFMLETIKNE